MTDRVPDGDITRLLHAAYEGDADALDKLFPLVYEQLRELARIQRGRWHGSTTLTATAIVHEAYIKLVGRHGAPPESRDHFFAIAARAMRHILCNYARDRQRLKRGGAADHVPIDDELDALPIVTDQQAIEIAVLDDALRRLEGIHQRQSRVVECRFFAGLTVEETAAALGLSTATVKRDWSMARAWLYREIRLAEAPHSRPAGRA